MVFVRRADESRQVDAMKRRPAEIVPCVPMPKEQDTRAMVHNGIPDDMHLLVLIRAEYGDIRMCAMMCNVTAAEMSEYIGNRPEMMAEVQRSREAHETIVQNRINEGARAGDPGMIAIKMKQEFLAAERSANGIGGRGEQPIDFTREVESVRDMTDEELSACIKRKIMQWTPEDGTPCPVCGAVNDGNKTNTKSKE